MSLNTEQTLLIVKHWQNARKAKLENALQKAPDQQDEQTITDVARPDRKDADSDPEETQKIIMNSYLRGATPERISKIGKIPLNVVREVIAKGNV